MKSVLTLVLALGLSVVSNAATIKSTDVKLEASRVTHLVTLVNKPGIMVNVLVEDLGGSTDVSDTQNAYLTIYSKGEMASVDATFDLGRIFQFTSARRISAGIYELKAVAFGLPDYHLAERTYVIDARKATADIQKVDCGSEFDCDAAEKFKSSITMTEKTK